MVIGIYGLGRFGSFWASTLSKIVDVQAYSRNSKVPEGVKSVSEDELCQSDVLFLCNSISSMEEVCKRISPKLKKGTVVADTCSVKVYPIEIMKEHLPDDIQILGTHPMFGPDSGRNGVKGLPVAVCSERIEDNALSEHFVVVFSIGIENRAVKRFGTRS